MNSLQNKRSRRDLRGITLIEILVSSGIISVLIGMALPAIQSARESARRAHCSFNIRQLGLALHNYHDLYGAVPSPNTNSDERRHQAFWMGLFSIQTRLLPQLEQQAVYNAINHALGAAPAVSPGLATPPEVFGPSLAANATAYQTGIAMFLCPSDGGPFAERGCNYRGNTGVGPYISNKPEFPDSANGIFPEVNLVTFASIRDGLAHTASFSERLRGGGSMASPNPSRDYFAMPRMVQTADGLLTACRIAARAPNVNFVQGGSSWYWTGREWTLYNHSQIPNGSIPDCVMSGMVGSAGQATARSGHPGGVNLGMVDGSVRFVADGIASPTWRALGTRSGGEVEIVE